MRNCNKVVGLIAFVIILVFTAGGAQAGFFDSIVKGAEELAAEQGLSTLKDSKRAVSEFGELPLINTNGEKFKTKLTNQKDGFGAFAKILDGMEDIKWWKVGEIWNASHRQPADLHQGADNDVTYVFQKKVGGVLLKQVVIKNRQHGLADDEVTFNEWEIAEQVQKMVKKAGKK